MNPYLIIKDEIREALRNGRPVVALESTVISHGLPWPDNKTLALEMEQIIRSEGAVPATVAIIGGKIRVGLDEAHIDLLASGREPVAKVSRRDMAYVCAKGMHGATTVAGTMIAAHMAGIDFFATGGTGGVHRDARESFDISADLYELSRTPVMVVSSGVKSILDIGATLEYLESLGIPVMGYGTDDFPAFYSRRSGYALHQRADTPQEAAKVWRAHKALGLQNGMLLANPVPPEAEIPFREMESFIRRALEEQHAQNIRGKDITPFLLGRIKELTEGRSLQTNLALLRNNARTAARVAVAFAE
ncbi:MAG: pseudouridine-5'-phosphate glycosidase [Chlorobi bacterium]|nr:pseudouridine-5'-phosphate glycosidase [Chlorobiota bacterium]